MKALNAFGFSVALLSCATVCAQNTPGDSITHLNEVVIEDRRLDEFNIGHYTWKPDTAVLHLASFGSLADLTRKFGFGHLRSYGPSGLATPSLRGSGASHTAVLWNGINIQSTLNGNMDLSLLPAAFIDDVEIQSGGSTSLYGSGSIGGNIHLNNKSRFEEGLTVRGSVAAGSFGHHFQVLSTDWSGGKFTSSTRLFQLSSRNNFPYLNRNVTPAVMTTRDHSAVQQFGLMQQNAWQINPRHIINLRLWLQDNEVQIPNPSTVNRPSQSDQQDNFVRAVASWQFTTTKMNVLMQSAYAHYLVDYKDPFASIRSMGAFNNVVNFIESTFSTKTHLAFTSGVNHTWEQGTIREYGNKSPSRHRLALYAGAKYETTRLNTALTIREELVNGSPIDPAATVSIEYNFTPRSTLFSSISRTYRIPTFNDLYWIGVGALGNKDLKTENGWSQEVGWRVKSLTNSNLLLNGQVTAFSNIVDNWIQWVPLTNGWSPVNLKKVWSRGTESSMSMQHQTEWHPTLELLYTYSRATTTEVYADGNASEVNKQLFFTPVHEASAKASFRYRSLSLMATETLTGRQFTDASNTSYLAMDPYYVLNLWISYETRVGKSAVSVFGEVNNTLNHHYQSRPGYPMPGRNYKCGLTIKFNKPISK